MILNCYQLVSAILEDKMTLAQLRYLVALDNSRHFRQAAAHLGISQPSLSNQLSNLERELDVQLFDRSTKPIAPTQVGEQVIAQARVVLGEAERLEVIVKGVTGEMAGELRIGILPTLAPYIVPLVIAKFSNRYPDVKVEVQELLSKQVAEYIKRDLIDVGLVTTYLASRDIVEEVLFEEPLLCYVAERHRLYRKKKGPSQRPICRGYLAPKRRACPERSNYSSLPGGVWERAHKLYVEF